MRQQTSFFIFLCLMIIFILGENVEAQCGSAYGRCPNNLCCSQWGWCGSSSAYCGQGCQPLYGRCSVTTTTTTTRTTTTTTTTSTTATPRGTPIFSCSVPGTMAITFDDGPYAVLKLLPQFTYFVT